MQDIALARIHNSNSRNHECSRSQLHQFVYDFDELVVKNDDDFAISGLIADSVIRLNFLTVLPRRRILGSIGKISPERHKRLLQKLSAYLVQNLDRKQ